MADCQPAWPRGSSPQLQAAERFCLKGTCIPMRTRFRRRTRAIRGWTVHPLTSAITTHSPSRIPCRLEASATAGAEACVTKQPSGYPYGLKLLHPIPDSNAHTRNRARRVGQGGPARGRGPAKRTAPLTFSQPLPGTAHFSPVLPQTRGHGLPSLCRGAFQLLDRLPGRASAKVNANAHCARKCPQCPDTRGLRPRRIPELARALEPALILRAGRLHRPAAQRFLPLLRTPILPALLVLLQMDHPAGPPFPRLLRPSCSSSPKRPCFLPWR
jgi:hypothetical protein